MIRFLRFYFTVLFCCITINAHAAIITNQLIHAADEGNHNAVITFLERGLPIDTRDQFGSTPLMRAAYQGHFDLVKLLISYGADVNAKDLGGATALHLAARRGHTNIVALLAKSEATVDSQDDEGFTPIMRATLGKHENTAETLIDTGATITLTNQYNESVLIHAAEAGNQRLTKKILSRDLPEPFRETETSTAYNIALNKGFEEIALLLSTPLTENLVVEAEAPIIENIVPASPASPQQTSFLTKFARIFKGNNAGLHSHPTTENNITQHEVDSNIPTGNIILSEPVRIKNPTPIPNVKITKLNSVNPRIDVPEITEHRKPAFFERLFKKNHSPNSETNIVAAEPHNGFFQGLWKKIAPHPDPEFIPHSTARHTGSKNTNPIAQHNTDVHTATANHKKQSSTIDNNRKPRLLTKLFGHNANAQNATLEEQPLIEIAPNQLPWLHTKELPKKRGFFNRLFGKKTISNSLNNNNTTEIDSNESQDTNTTSRPTSEKTESALINESLPWLQGEANNPTSSPSPWNSVKQRFSNKSSQSSSDNNFFSYFTQPFNKSSRTYQQKYGTGPVIITPDIEDTPPIYVVQVGAFPTKDAAVDYYQQYERNPSLKHHSFTLIRSHKTDHVYLHIGNFPKAAKAEALCSYLKVDTIHCKVIKHP